MELAEYPAVFDDGEGGRMIQYAPDQPSVRFPAGKVDVPIARKLRDLGWTHKRMAAMFGVTSTSAVTNALSRAERKHQKPSRDYRAVLEKELGVERLDPVDMLHDYAWFCTAELMMEDDKRPNMQHRRIHAGVLAQLKGNGLVMYGWIIFFNENMREWSLRPRTVAEAKAGRWYTDKIRA